MASSYPSAYASPASKAQPLGRAQRPDELFSRNGPLGARADVRVVTSDGQELWLHRIVLEMWSELFRDLVLAAEEHADVGDDLAVTITLTDTAADMMLLLSCLYPASHHPDRPQGSTLDAPSCLPLLRLADKYHCPHIIHRAAAFALQQVLPRLADAACAADAADYLQLPHALPSAPVSSPSAAAAAAADPSVTAVLEWVVACLELAVRLELRELEAEAARLLGRHFFEWELQAEAHRELMARVARVLAPELFVDLVLRAIPPPPPAVKRAAASPAVGRGAPGVRNGGGGGGGPRIVPVVVAAAGPAAAVAPAAVAAPPLLAPQEAPPPPPPVQHQPHHLPPPQPFQEQLPAQPAQHPHAGHVNMVHHHNHHHQQLQQQPQAFWHAAPFGLGAGGMHGQPEPLLGPGHGGW